MKQLVWLLSLVFLILSGCSKNGENGKEPGEKLTDEQLMDLIQEHTFKYFFDFAHPVSGMARERSNGNNEIVTTGGSGFGVMVIIVGIERGYISREEGVEHLLKMVRFLRDDCSRYHGVWTHWLNGSTGETIPFSEKDDGGDLVETAFMIQGLLTARQYFNMESENETELREIITGLWNDVEWDWYTNGGDFLYWHWSPNFGWEMNLPIRGFNETMIVYLLAIASPTHPVDKSLYDTGWAGDNYEATLVVDESGYYGGPLFFTHYSYLGFDPRFSDSYIDATRFDSYFDRNREQTLLNRKWCIDRSVIYKYYNDSCWGLTASDDPVHGYLAHEPSVGLDNGTLTPTAAVSSIIYTPDESLASMRYFYEKYGESGLWGEYGYDDAFNLDRVWYSNSYLAIDQGPIAVMIENYRSGIIRDSFMSDPDIMRMVEIMGFVYKF